MKWNFYIAKVDFFLLDKKLQERERASPIESLEEIYRLNEHASLLSKQNINYAGLFSFLNKTV